MSCYSEHTVGPIAGEVRVEVQVASCTRRIRSGVGDMGLMAHTSIMRLIQRAVAILVMGELRDGQQ